MTDSRRLVEHIIDTDIVVRKGLQRGIINSRALARFIQKTDGVDASPDAILGIIRRYEPESEETPGNHLILRDCELVMRSRIGVLTLENGPDVMKRIAEFASAVKTTRGENLRVVVGVKSIMVMADEKPLNQFRETFRDEEVIGLCEKLVEISIQMPPEVAGSKGVIARITTELALNDVNLCGTICCSPELGLLVDEKDAPRALEALQRLVSEDSTTTDYVTRRKKLKPFGAMRQAESKKLATRDLGLANANTSS